MNSYVSAHRAAQATLRVLAAGLGFVAGASILFFGAQGLTARAAQVDAIEAWCGTSKACFGVPRAWSSSALTVQRQHLAEATDLVNKTTPRGYSTLIKFPPIRVVSTGAVVPRLQGRQKVRSNVGGTGK